MTKLWCDINVHQIEAETAIIDTLEVTGEIILDGGLEVKGNTILDGDLEVKGDTILDQKLDVAGLSKLSGGAEFLSSGGTASTLNHYEENKTTLTGEWFGNSGGSVQCAGVIVRIGSIVTISLESCAGAINGTTTYNVSLPNRFRPSTDKFFPCVVSNNGGAKSTAGLIVIRSSGSIDLYPDPVATGFTNSMSFDNSDFTYMLI